MDSLAIPRPDIDSLDVGECLRLLATEEVFEHVRSLSIIPWAPGDKERWVRVLPVHVSGRRVAASASTG